MADMMTRSPIDERIFTGSAAMPQIAAVATWTFGQIAVRAALPLLRQGQSALDAALAGAQAVEDDPTVQSVGYGGIANAIGAVSLDACVMEGRTLNCGGVAGVENIRHVAALARRVMERTPHVLLVGEGARLFAVQQGFPLETLHTPEAVAQWYKERPKAAPPGQPPRLGPGHDTVTVLTLDQKGSLGGVCTTSGLAHKLPGRVGDSPLIGAGLYVDDTAGAAGATGVGEEIIRSGGSFFVVEQMRAGRSPQEACEAAIHRVNAVAIRRGVHPARVAFLALDVKGRIGAACTTNTNFRYAVNKGDQTVELRTAPEIAATPR
ncbi:MAG: N(4)-(beta-N-acetylglucosaminyl)-L-asparaginase [Gemmataceae bacterium]|nr:N(4)-(beta-N-acetylglucosaminyl)-L-asparaginase [Gemmataceae bacterium]